MKENKKTELRLVIGGEEGKQEFSSELLTKLEEISGSVDIVGLMRLRKDSSSVMLGGLSIMTHIMSELGFEYNMELNGEQVKKATTYAERLTRKTYHVSVDQTIDLEDIKESSVKDILEVTNAEVKIKQLNGNVTTNIEDYRQELIIMVLLLQDFVEKVSKALDSISEALELASDQAMWSPQETEGVCTNGRSNVGNEGCK